MYVSTSGQMSINVGPLCKVRVTANSDCDGGHSTLQTERSQEPPVWQRLYDRPLCEITCLPYPEALMRLIGQLHDAEDQSAPRMWVFCSFSVLVCTWHCCMGKSEDNSYH